MKHWDSAFFAQSRSENLLRSDGASEHTLIDQPPVFLRRRSANVKDILILDESARINPENDAPQKVHVHVVRNGKRRLSVPLPA